MMKQDPSLMHPAEVIQDLRHHLQAMENALQQISQGADHLINNLNQAEAALEGLDRQIGEISGFLSKANPSDPQQILPALERLLSILGERDLSQIAGDGLQLVGDVLSWIQERIELDRLRSFSVDQLLEQKQLQKALPGFAIGSGIVSVALFLLLVLLGASPDSAFSTLFWINVLGYVGFLFRGTFMRSS